MLRKCALLARWKRHIQQGKQSRPRTSMMIDTKPGRARREYLCAACSQSIELGELQIGWTTGQHFCLACWQLYVPRAMALEDWFEAKRKLKTLERMVSGK